MYLILNLFLPSLKSVRLYLKLRIFSVVCHQVHLFLVSFVSCLSYRLLLLQPLPKCLTLPLQGPNPLLQYLKIWICLMVCHQIHLFLVSLMLDICYKVLNIILSWLLINLLIWAGLVNHSSITAFQSATLKINFDFKKQPEKPHETTVHATFTNLTSSSYMDFVFQAAVPKVASWRLYLLSSIFELSLLALVLWHASSQISLDEQL